MLIVDKLGAQRQDRFGWAKDLGLQNLVAVQGGLATLLRQAVRAVLPAKDEIATAIDADDQTALYPCLVQDAHADQPIDHVGPHSSDGVRTDLGQVVVQGVVTRNRLLIGLRQPIEIVEDRSTRFTI